MLVTHTDTSQVRSREAFSPNVYAFTLWVVLVLFVTLNYVNVHVNIKLTEVFGHKWAYLIPR